MSRRIYINNYNLELLPQLLKTLHPFLLREEVYTLLWSSEGIFKVKGTGGIEQMEPVDHPIRVYPEYYEGLTLIEDPSFFKTYEVHRIPNEFEACPVKKRMYASSHSKSGWSDVRFVIELGRDDVPCDFYMEVDEENTSDLSALKSKIIEFLSLLF